MTQYHVSKRVIILAISCIIFLIMTLNIIHLNSTSANVEPCEKIMQPPKHVREHEFNLEEKLDTKVGDRFKRWKKKVQRPDIISGKVNVPRNVLPQSSIFDISPFLQKCKGDTSSEIFHGRAKKLITKSKCNAPMPYEEFVCLAKCKIEEPELEKSMKPQLTAKYKLSLLKSLCEQQTFPILVWINDGHVRVKMCTRGKLRGRTIWNNMARLLLMLTCIVDIPNVVFGMDNSDWATPTVADNFESIHWSNIVPAIVRLVGSESHPSMLWPTGSFVANTAYCSHRGDNINEWFMVCPLFQNSLNWNDKDDTILWRGSFTGVPFYPGLTDYLPRTVLSKIVLDEHNKMIPGYDVGITGTNEVTSAMKKDHFLETHSFVDRIPKNELKRFKYIIHVDGHTSSWGLAHKLTLQSMILWQESNLSYREFYYTHLKPLIHYLPLSADFDNLHNIREWVQNYPDEAAKVASTFNDNIRKLFKQRLRPEDIWCYLSRMLHTLAGNQETSPTSDVMEETGFDLSEFIELDDYEKVRNQGDRTNLNVE